MTMVGELNSECMSFGDFNACKDFMTKVQVRNTFLDCSVDDPWVVNSNSILRRQQTDSILHCNSIVRDELARGTYELGKSQYQDFPAVPTALDVDQNVLSSSEEEEGAKHSGNDSDALLESLPTLTVPETQASREDFGGALGGELGGCTTVMMKQIPLKYSQRKLLREINDSGFAGQYDFLYLPMDARSHANRGFAFVNMVSAGVAEEFYKKFHGQFLRHFSAEKAVVVLPADLQGFEENALQYATTVARQGMPAGRRTGHTKPIFLRKLPPHIAAKLDDDRTTAPPVQKDKTVASRFPEKTMRHSQDSVQKMADLLQQALLPAMLQASLPLLLAQAQAPPVAAKRTPGFCPYCGKKRLPDHSFCAYCGSSF